MKKAKWECPHSHQTLEVYLIQLNNTPKVTMRLSVMRDYLDRVTEIIEDARIKPGMAKAAYIGLIQALGLRRDRNHVILTETTIIAEIHMNRIPFIV